MAKITLESIEKEQCNPEKAAAVRDITVGDTICVHQTIAEGKKRRIQKFEGLVVRVANPNQRSSITVRRIIDRIGVEKTYLVHSPLVEKIELIKRGKVRRARLFYMWDLIGAKATRVKAVDSYNAG